MTNYPTVALEERIRSEIRAQIKAEQAQGHTDSDKENEDPEKTFVQTSTPRRKTPKPAPYSLNSPRTPRHNFPVSDAERALIVTLRKFGTKEVMVLSETVIKGQVAEKELRAECERLERKNFELANFLRSQGLDTPSHK